jgi:hypothetical protein
MVTIAWNPLRFHLLDVLPKGNTFHAKYYRVNILTGLLPLHPQVDERRLAIHADNARPDTARNSELCAKKIGSASSYTHRIHLISHHPTFSLRIYQLLSAGNRLSIA